MKSLRISLFLIYGLFIANSVVAQVRIGIVGGRTESSLSLEKTDFLKTNFSNRKGFGVGAVIDLDLKHYFGLRLEPMYLEEGQEKINNLEIGLIKSSLNTNYFELPILLNLPFNKGGINPYLVGGASVSYLLEAHDEFGDDFAEDELLELGIERKQDIKDEINSIDYGYTYGGGLSIPIGNSSLFAEGRYSEWLTDTNDFESNLPPTKTNGWQFLVGITSQLGGQDGDIMRQEGYGETIPRGPIVVDGPVLSRKMGDCEVGLRVEIWMRPKGIKLPKKDSKEWEEQRKKYAILTHKLHEGFDEVVIPMGYVARFFKFEPVPSRTGPYTGTFSASVQPVAWWFRQRSVPTRWPRRGPTHCLYQGGSKLW